ncbi:bifunctional precorrin-2 dehydrogenase/sirohydrochlorin ferrochelatase [Lewinella sp. W8]|uniref:precorrin-2 dehydrogenase/sirohydrochlorin ferrochelatase family protein n=1 Tax=Lewinella sp. W8 TaxID=2528208 RepID=UPI0010679D2C|nr:bifunctional precorrin-2 dehydrogenase/sirohydrochlorin ferrochelatase [Lewinella sp. W8]MTB53193.1 bifunctional precorrin-2 dehydrogenase/sirohydrochlorin ferrochelatase [Lewinella sp. W8]
MNNPLYPAFFRLDRLQMLVVGAGEVGEEKLSFILKSSPNARVTIVAPWMGEDLKRLLDQYRAEADTLGDAAQDAGNSPEAVTDGAETPRGHWRTTAGGHVTWYDREFRDADVDQADLVVAATNFREVNHRVWRAAKAARRLTNVADTPSLCDFYLGSIVTRGPLKVAISTNGQSPTFAKRFRQWLEAELPEAETSQLITNLKVFRDRLTGDFATKVRELNAVTSGLLSSPKPAPPSNFAPARQRPDAASELAPKEDAAPVENTVE